MKPFLRVVIPLLFMVVFAAVYIATSGAPLRVHLLSLICLLLGFCVPAVIAGNIAGLKKRWLVVTCFIVASILVWDATAHVVIYKVEFMGIIRHYPWVYFLGYATLLGAVSVSCFATGALQAKT